MTAYQLLALNYAQRSNLIKSANIESATNSGWNSAFNGPDSMWSGIKNNVINPIWNRGAALGSQVANAATAVPRAIGEMGGGMAAGAERGLGGALQGGWDGLTGSIGQTFNDGVSNAKQYVTGNLASGAQPGAAPTPGTPPPAPTTPQAPAIDQTGDVPGAMPTTPQAPVIDQTGPSYTPPSPQGQQGGFPGAQPSGPAPMSPMPPSGPSPFHQLGQPGPQQPTGQPQMTQPGMDYGRMFQNTHHSAYDPNSSMDRHKMDAMKNFAQQHSDASSWTPNTFSRNFEQSQRQHH